MDKSEQYKSEHAHEASTSHSPKKSHRNSESSRSLRINESPISLDSDSEDERKRIKKEIQEKIAEEERKRGKREPSPQFSLGSHNDSDDEKQDLKKEIRRKLEHMELERAFLQKEPSPPETRFEHLDVLTRMRSGFIEGPLAVLSQCVKDKTLVKVLTRSFKHVRGICTGILLAFDKHWNLVLSDVEEIYSIPRTCKIPFLRPLTGSDKLNNERSLQGHFMTLSVGELPAEGKGSASNFSRVRKMKKVFLRGDNVVIVIPLSN